MADFPINPNIGDTFTSNDGTVWEWDGYSWHAGGGLGSGGISEILVSANSASTVNANGLNFINTASVTVLVGSGETGNANVAFNATGIQGSQGGTGSQGTTGIQGDVGIQG
jgi:hypothetical protein